ncbi:MAG TPA: NAD(P)-binding domain-containing protein [Streptosporangiaceae bacterium]|nr:NAD(P)-binding domain-containing protein [Streptosporangiaceae bacterium]
MNDSVDRVDAVSPFDTADTVIVGAGPYGLSLAAHLRGAGVHFRQFGLPMHLWRSAMPRGMYLKSQGFASNISDPQGTHTLEAFCRATGRPYASYGLPVALDTFISYGQWFKAELAPELEEVLVTGVTRHDGFFRLELSNGDSATARRVVVAVGVEHFAYMPALLAGLPQAVCTHSGAHTDLSVFHGRTVVVVGAGQSALESAALLHESGAMVQVVAREQQVAWNGEPLALDRPLASRLAEPESGLGSGWATWFYSNHPGLFRKLPQSTRVYRSRTALGPAGACWLRGRVDGQFPILTGHTLTSATAGRDGVRLGLTTRDGDGRELNADHVIAATGYRPDLRRLPFICSSATSHDGLGAQLRTVAGTTAVGKDYQSSVPGLYFIGPAVAPTFGPVMRFVYGSAHAASVVAGRLASTADRRSRTAVGAGR